MKKPADTSTIREPRPEYGKKATVKPYRRKTVRQSARMIARAYEQVFRELEKH